MKTSANLKKWLLLPAAGATAVVLIALLVLQPWSASLGPEEALAAAAAEWDAITDKVGREQQVELWQQALESYRSLGLIE